MIFIDWGCVTVCLPAISSFWHNDISHFTYPNWNASFPPPNCSFADLLISVSVTTIFLVPRLELLESSLIPDVLSTAKSHRFYTTVFQVPIISWLDFANSVRRSYLVSQCHSSTLPFSPLPCRYTGTPPPHWPSQGRAQTQSKLPIVPHCLCLITSSSGHHLASRISRYLHRVAPQTSSLLSHPITFRFKPCPTPRIPSYHLHLPNTIQKAPVYPTAATPGFSDSLNWSEFSLLSPQNNLLELLLWNKLIPSPSGAITGVTPTRKQCPLRALSRTSVSPTGPAEGLAASGAQ